MLGLAANASSSNSNGSEPSCDVQGADRGRWLAADRLYLTPCAVSHALGRLNTQFDDPLVGPIIAATQPMIVMQELRARYDLQVLAAPSYFPMRFAWPVRNASDPHISWLRNTAITAYEEYQTEIDRKLADLMIPLGD
jgi:hypothetical protein